MSNFNYLRITNLNYNNNSSKIDNELFYLNGENTMLNLKNGGGKSVLVQMMIAPFVRNRYRDLNDRTFDSYFTGKMPTYIMIEWNLDDGAGYLLTGMMVRKKETVSDENSKETLDIINFIHEYKSRNDFDIKSIPIIEENDRQRKIKSFANSKKLFEEIKKGQKYDFNYYDMNNSATSRAYFNKLKEYGIDNKEWENIIKKVNLTESGLSQLFKEAKNTEGLIKKWFLPTIEEKLSRNEDRMKNFNDIVEKYIYQYKSNKSDIDRKNKIDIFNKKAEVLQELTNEFKESRDKLKFHENKIANYSKTLNNLSEENEKNIIVINEKMKENEDNIKEVRYEEESMKIYEILDEIDDINEKMEKELISTKELNNNLIDVKRQQNILNCANVYERYKDYSKELQKIEIKLKALRDKQKDKAPVINDLGYSIKVYLESKETALAKDISLNEDKLNSQMLYKEELKKSIEEAQKILNDIAREEGKLHTKVMIFDEYENSFNKNYNENLLRNIEGYFNDESLLGLSKKILLQKDEYEKEKVNIQNNIIEKKKLLNSKNSKKESLSKSLSRLQVEIDNLKLEIDRYNEDIKLRKDIIKYVNFEESKIFDNDDIINEFTKKVEFLNADLQNLYKEKDVIKKEINKLKTGKILELPKEFIEKLRNREIDIIYGMEYLKKNGYPLEDNIKLVEKNPFIPYSIIMDNKEISILEKEYMDIFTSVPIPIISRESLDELIIDKSGNIVKFDNVRFYISFNNKLLNEEELAKLIDLKEEDIIKIEKQIDNKNESIVFYNDKKGFIKSSTLTKDIYNNALNSNKEKELEYKRVNEELILINNEIGELTDNINDDEDKFYELKDKIKENSNKQKDYEELTIKYEKYKKDKEEYDIQLEKKKLYTQNLATDKKELLESEKSIEGLKELLGNLNTSMSDNKNKLSGFNSFDNGNIIKKDLEDLLSEYEVITKEISENLAQLEENHKREKSNYDKAETELNDKMSLYKLDEKEFRNVIYDARKEGSLITSIKKLEREISDSRDIISKLDKEKAIKESDIEHIKAAMKAIVNKDTPKERNLLFNKNFKEELAKLNINKKELEKDKIELEKEITIIDANIVALKEFDFTIEEEIDVEINLNELGDITGKLKRDFRNINKDIDEKQKKVYDFIINISNEEIFNKDPLFTDAIDSLIKVCDNADSLLKQLNIVTDSYMKLVEKLLHDIEIINKEENNILENLYEYISLVNENINEIDDNSSITIGGKSVKMLKISVVNMEEDKELYMIRLKEYIGNIRDYCVNLLEKNENISEYVQKNLTLVKLYDEMISIASINIKLYKIEENRQKQISWDEVAKNSGGEGFLSAFVILSSLLSYMRREDKDIFSRKESSKVLIMDNPFAQTNAEHLLKPLIDISKKSKTQLICLTGLGGESIINRFDNIYVLNLVNSKLKNGLRIMKSEHFVGEEEKEVIIPSRVKVEDIQMKLF